MNELYKRILAVGAHFDDVEVCCGGTLAKLSKGGSEVRVVVVGNGDYTNFDGKQLRNHDMAHQEGLDALRNLGLGTENLRNLGFPEKNVTIGPSLIDSIEREVTNFDPTLILTHWLHDSHQDHSATAYAVMAAARYHFAIWLWEPIFPSGRVNTMPFPPQVYVDISGFEEAKRNALLAHKSQVEKFYQRGVRWIEGIEARSAYRGFECKCRHAEAFYVYRQKVS